MLILRLNFSGRYVSLSFYTKYYSSLTLVIFLCLYYVYYFSYLFP